MRLQQQRHLKRVQSEQALASRKRFRTQDLLVLVDDIQDTGVEDIYPPTPRPQLRGLFDSPPTPSSFDAQAFYQPVQPSIDSSMDAVAFARQVVMGAQIATVEVVLALRLTRLAPQTFTVFDATVRPHMITHFRMVNSSKALG